MEAFQRTIPRNQRHLSPSTVSTESNYHFVPRLFVTTSLFLLFPSFGLIIIIITTTRYVMPQAVVKTDPKSFITLSTTATHPELLSPVFWHSRSLEQQRSDERQAFLKQRYMTQIAPLKSGSSIFPTSSGGRSKPVVELCWLGGSWGDEGEGVEFNRYFGSIDRKAVVWCIHLGRRPLADSDETQS